MGKRGNSYHCLSWRARLQLRRRSAGGSHPSCRLDMPSASGPDLKKYMDKRLSIKLNANRTVTGVLRGFDQFMNLVLDDAAEMVCARRHRADLHTARPIHPVQRARRRRFDPFTHSPSMRVIHPQTTTGDQNNIGMIVIRGNSVVMIEALEKLGR